MGVQDESNNPYWQRIRAARREHELQRQEIEDRHEAQIKAELAASEAVLVEAIVAGYESGLSQSAIGRAYKTKDYRTIRAFIERAAQRRKAIDRLEEIEPMDRRNGWEIVDALPGEHPANFNELILQKGKQRIVLSTGIDNRRRKVYDAENRQISAPEGIEWAFEQIDEAIDAYKTQGVAPSKTTNFAPTVGTDPEPDFEWGEE